ncbi:hypothetical protein [Candidatus Poriferisodalis sp.]|uniref:hypothetical protein n=1 Tax=Candidatus Poriferisodalis sp. TaxID=3101277 RepID=UPI003C702C49
MTLIARIFGEHANAVHLGTIYEEVAQRYPAEMHQRPYPVSNRVPLRSCIHRSLSKLKDQGLAVSPTREWWRISTQ